MTIDAHAHLWKTQNGTVNNKPVVGLGNGLSDFGGKIRQMMPPAMGNTNPVETLVANMDYAGVSGAAITQEYIDGNQDSYLLEAKKKYNNRIKITCLYEENDNYSLDGFDGIKICAQRLANVDLTKHISVFADAAKAGKYVSIDMGDGDCQTGAMQEIIDELPELKIAIGHFGMVTRGNWEAQIKLARNRNVYIESGGITWLFHSEFYPYPSAVKAIRTAADICGAEKLMWGSDYPRTMTEITYKMSFDFIQKSKELSDEEKKKFLGETAFEFYGFNDLNEVKYIKNMLED